MRYVIWFLALIILMLLQSMLQSFHLSPVNLLLILIVVSLLFSDFDFGLLLTAAAGIMLDMLSATSDGTIAFSFLVVFLGTYFVINFVLAREPNLLIVFTAVLGATLAYGLLFLGFNLIFRLLGQGVALNYGTFFISDFPKLILFNLILTYPVLEYFIWVEKLSKKFQKHEEQPIRN